MRALEDMRCFERDKLATRFLKSLELIVNVRVFLLYCLAFSLRIFGWIQELNTGAETTCSWREKSNPEISRDSKDICPPSMGCVTCQMAAARAEKTMRDPSDWATWAKHHSKVFHGFGASCLCSCFLLQSVKGYQSIDPSAYGQVANIIRGPMRRREQRGRGGVGERVGRTCVQPTAERKCRERPKDE